jgi:hypothetical protein
MVKDVYTLLRKAGGYVMRSPVFYGSDCLHQGGGAYFINAKIAQYREDILLKAGYD